MDDDQLTDSNEPSEEVSALDQMKKELDDLKKQVQETSMQKASLEARLSEVSSPAQQPSQQNASADDDFRERAKSVLENAGVDPDTGARQFESLLNDKAGTLVNQMTDNVRKYIEIDKQIGKIEESKPYLKKLRPQFEERLAGYIQAGKPISEAMTTVEKEFDSLFEDFESSKAPKKPEVPQGARTNTSANLEPPPQPEETDVDEAHWVAERNARREARISGVAPPR